MTGLYRNAAPLIEEQKYEERKRPVSNATRTFPHAPQPHNQMGVSANPPAVEAGPAAWLPAANAPRKDQTAANPLLPAFGTRRDPNGMIHVMERRAER